MSLQGSLDTFAVADVLTLLSSTRKTGELRVAGQQGAGRLWLDAGQVVATDVSGAVDAVDALFALLRVTAGSFTFDTGAAPEAAGEARPVDELVAAAQARLAEWREIEAVVPSLGTAVRLVPEPPGATVVIQSEQWSVVVAVAEGGSVASVAERLSVGEFEACRLVKSLVDAGLVHVGTHGGGEGRRGDPEDLVEIPARARRRPALPTRSSEGAAGGGEELPAPAGPAAADPVSVERELAVLGPRALEAARAAAEAKTPEEREAALQKALTDDNGEPINRGLLLKFLSSVRS